jgi:hypothetical protein
MSDDSVQVSNAMPPGFTTTGGATVRYSAGYILPSLTGESEPGRPTAGTPEIFNRPGVFDRWNVDVGEALKIIKAKNEKIAKLEKDLATEARLAGERWKMLDAERQDHAITKRELESWRRVAERLEEEKTKEATA